MWKLRRVEFRFLIGLTFCLSMLCLVGCNRKYISRFAPGPIQAIASSNELWLFLEMDRIVTRPSGAFDAPRTIPVGHWQEVLIFTNGGGFTRTRIQPDDNKVGVTFNRNITTPFVFDGRMMLCKGGSRDYMPTFYEWSGQRFKKLSREANAQFVKHHNLDGRPKDKYEILRNYSKSNGWEVIYSEYIISDDEYQWGDVRVTQTVTNIGGNYRIEIQLADRASEPVRIEVDGTFQEMSGAEFKQIPREDYGHPKNPKR